MARLERQTPHRGAWLSSVGVGLPLAVGRCLWQVGAWVALIVLCSNLALAQRNNTQPSDLLDVGVKEHLNDPLPLDLDFVDSTGKAVKLGDYFDGTHPVVLTLNYSNCPMLCSLQLNGLFDALKAMKWDLGDQYRMLTVSIDPTEPTERGDDAAEVSAAIRASWQRTGLCVPDRQVEADQGVGRPGWLSVPVHSQDGRVRSHGGHDDLHAGRSAVALSLRCRI